MKTRLIAALAAIVFVNVGTAHAQAAKTYESLAGRWNGSVESAQGKQEVQLTVDSTATGWHGSALAPAMGNDPAEFTSIVIKADTIMMTLNAGGTDVGFSGWINPANHQFEGSMFFGGTEAGSFAFKRVTAAPAAAKPPRR